MKNKLGIIFIILILLSWEICGSLEWLDVELFPLPTLILKNTATHLLHPEMWLHIFRSLSRMAIGFIIGWPLGVILGVLSGLSGNIRTMLLPLINFGYGLPKVALLPLYLVLFGIGDLSKITLIATGVFFLVYGNVLNGAGLILSSPLMNVKHLYLVKGRRFLFEVVLKGLYLDILTGTKAAFGYGLVLVVVSEAQMSRQGIGYFLWQSWDQFRIIDIYTAILIIGLIGLISGAIFDKMTAALFPKYTLS